ncbi:MAG: SDR family NAD(P)-dependent oxidoreductase [Gammaproteobacteria bacterium]|nr:SDR family NAD(P)-dependent oxidoreductase [Gammaproteobacteria bacterium]
MAATEKSVIKGQWVLITGASSGIGAACAAAFAAVGANLVLTARRVERLEELSKQIGEEYGVECLPLFCDVSDKVVVAELFAQLEQQACEIDILVNNAGLALSLDKFQDGKAKEWEQMIDTNIKGLLYVTQCCLKGMLARNRGYIFNLASISSHYVYSGGAVYCGTKFAVDALTKGLRLDLLGKNIRVTQISPGAVGIVKSEVRQSHSIFLRMFFENIQPVTRHYGAPWGAY